MTRLEHFAAAALSGILANSGYYGSDPAACARHALAYAKALADEIDGLFGADCTDPDKESGDAPRR